MELASLAFMIDSSRAVTAVQVLDQMAQAAQRAKAGADILSQGVQQQAMALLQAHQSIDAVTTSWKAYSGAMEAGAMAAKGMTDAVVKNVEAMNAHRGSVGLMTNEINLLTGATKTFADAQRQMTAAANFEPGNIENLNKMRAVGDAFRDLSRTVGVSATDLAEFNKYVVGLGVSTEGSRNALATMTKVLRDSSSATAEQRSILTSYGVSLTDVTGQAKTAAQAFSDLVAKMSDLADGPNKSAALGKFGISSAEDMRALADATTTQIKQTRDLAAAEQQRFNDYERQVNRQIQKIREKQAEEQKELDSKPGWFRKSVNNVGMGDTLDWLTGQGAAPWTVGPGIGSTVKSPDQLNMESQYLYQQKRLADAKIDPNASFFSRTWQQILNEWNYNTGAAANFRNGGEGFVRPELTGASAVLPMMPYELQQGGRSALLTRQYFNKFGDDYRSRSALDQIPMQIDALIESGQIDKGAKGRATDQAQVNNIKEVTNAYIDQTHALQERVSLEQKIAGFADESPAYLAGKRAELDIIEKTTDEMTRLKDQMANGSAEARNLASVGIERLNTLRETAGKTATEMASLAQVMAMGAQSRSLTVQESYEGARDGVTGGPFQRAQQMALINARQQIDQSSPNIDPAERERQAQRIANLQNAGASRAARTSAGDQSTALGIQVGSSFDLINASLSGFDAPERSRFAGEARQAALSNPFTNVAGMIAGRTTIANNNRTAAVYGESSMGITEADTVAKLSSAYTDNQRSLTALNATVAAYKAARSGSINVDDQAIKVISDLTVATTAAQVASAQQLRSLQDQNELLGKTMNLSGGAAQQTAVIEQAKLEGRKKLLDIEAGLELAERKREEAAEKGNQKEILLAQASINSFQQKLEVQTEYNSRIEEETRLLLQNQQISRDTAALNNSTDALKIAEKEVELIGQSVEQRQRELSILRETIAAKRESGGTISDSRLQAIQNNAKAAELSAEAQKAGQMLDQMVQQFGQGTAQSIVQAFQEGTARGQSIWTTFATGLQRVLYNAIASVLSSQVFQPLFRSALSSVSGIFTSSGGGGILGGSSGSGGGMGGLGDIASSVKGAFSGDGFLSAASIDNFGYNTLGIGTYASSGITNAAGNVIAGPGALGSVPDMIAGGGISGGVTGGLSSYLPFAGVGLGAALQFAQGNVGGGLGTLGGAGLGFAVGGPVGMGIGAALGSFVGGSIFGGKKPSVGPGGGIGFGLNADGTANIGFSVGDNGYDAAAKNSEAANQVGAAALKFFGMVGGKYAGTGVSDRGAELGYDAGLKMYTGGDDTSNGRGRFKSLEEAMAASLIAVVKNSIVTGVSKDIQDRIKAVNTSQDMEGLLQYIAQLNQIFDGFKNWAPPITAAEQAMNQLNASFEVAKKAAESLSKSTDDLQKSYEKQKQYLVDQFVQPLNSRFLRATGRGLEADLNDFDLQAAQTRQAAKALGPEAVAQANLTLNAERQAIQQRALDQAMASQKQAYEGFTSELRSMRDVWKGIAEQMIKFRDSLKVGALSTLSPEQQMIEAQRQYSVTLAKARGGDINAANELQGYATQALQQTQSYYASGKGYADYFDKVQNDLTEFAGYAEGQVSVADKQLGVQKSIDTTTRTILQVIQDMNAAKNGSASSGGGASLSLSTQDGVIGFGGVDARGFRGDAASKSTEQNIKEAYEQYWGRTPDAWEVKAWTDLQSQGLTTGGGIISSLMYAPQAQKFTASGVPQYAAGGDHMGGLALVGEQGPELVAMGRARVYNAADTRRMMAGNDNAQLTGLMRTLIGRIDALTTVSAESGDGAHSRLDGLREDLNSLTRTLKTSQLVS